MTGVLDLTILNSGLLSHAVAMVRYGDDFAVTHLPCGAELLELGKFRSSMNAALLGHEQRPDTAALAKFGAMLHSFIMRGDLGKLYAHLSPADHVRINLISDHADLQVVPWEFLQEPGQQPGPRLERSVARIVPTIGVPKPIPLPLRDKVRVLFVCAEPQDQEPVSWPEMQESIKRTFSARLPDRFELEVVEAADLTTLAQAVARNDFDIFHFSGHGEVVDGVGNLILMNRISRKSSRVTATQLANLLGGRRFRLAVLSACETSAGNFAADFAVLAETLVQRGLPAVVANQFPLPDKSAAIFVEGLYSELLRSGDIDRATSEGRIKLAVLLADGTNAVLEWGIPTIYRRLGASQLFQP